MIPRLRRADPRPPVGQLVVISWAGMRGVVSLAAALALPLDFPERDLLVFLAFCAILATLVLQGTTLGWVIPNLADRNRSALSRRRFAWLRATWRGAHSGARPASLAAGRARWELV